MKSRKRLFSAAPEGTAALFFIQIFATLGFAVLYSTLVLYATKHLQLSVKEATMLMGVFGAFNYGLHLFGGYLGGRFLSNRNLFVGGMALQVVGCGCIAVGSLALFYVGLAFFLTGSVLNVTCLNMMRGTKRVRAYYRHSCSIESGLGIAMNAPPPRRVCRVGGKRRVERHGGQ